MEESTKRLEEFVPALACGSAEPKAIEMRALMLEPPEEFLADRRRKGADRWDEVWDGVLHMPPPPTVWHQQFGSELIAALRPSAKERGLKITYDPALADPGQADWTKNFRVPDIVLYREEHLKNPERLAGADLVVEILSRNDESEEKVSFYAARRVTELLYVDPKTRAFKFRVLDGAIYRPFTDERGSAYSSVLGVTFSLVEGPKLRVSTASAFTDV